MYPQSRQDVPPYPGFRPHVEQSPADAGHVQDDEGDEEGRDGGKEIGKQPHDRVQDAVRPVGAQDPQGHGDEQGDEQRQHRQRQGPGQSAEHHVRDVLAGAVGGAEIQPAHLAHPVRILLQEGPVQSHLRPGLFQHLLGIARAHGGQFHHGRIVRRQIGQQEGDKGHSDDYDEGGEEFSAPFFPRILFHIPVPILLKNANKIIGIFCQ